MKILFIAPISGPTTGLSFASLIVYKRLKQQHNVILIDYSKGGLKHGVNSLVRIFQVLHYFFLILKNRNKCDCIYMTLSQSIAGNIKDNFILFLLRKNVDNTIVHLHGGGLREQVYKKSTILRYLSKITLSNVRKCIVLGESLKYIFSGLVPEKNIRIVPNFASNECFLSENMVKEKFNDISNIRILFLSNLIPGKGHEELLEAYELLIPSTQKKYSIDYAGNFENEVAKEEFLTRINKHENIKYHGSVSGTKKSRLLHDSHIFCLPTYYKYEGQPISILEAYASGCSVITTDHAGIKDIFKNNINGFYISKQSPASISSILETLVNSSDKLRHIGLNNSEFYKTYFTKSRYEHDMVTIIEKVTEETN